MAANARGVLRFASGVPVAAAWTPGVRGVFVGVVNRAAAAEKGEKGVADGEEEDANCI